MNLGIKSGVITYDGDKSLLKAIYATCPKVPIQKCLVHIQRMCKIWLSLHPKTRAGFELRDIVSKLHFINIESKKQFWIKEIVDWYKIYREFVNQNLYNEETGRYWCTHKLVRRSFSVIKKALNKMLFFLELKNP